MGKNGLLFKILKSVGRRTLSAYKSCLRKIVIGILIVLIDFIAVNSIFFERNNAVAETTCNDLPGETWYTVIKNLKLPVIEPLLTSITYFVCMGIAVSEGGGEGAAVFMSIINALGLDPVGNNDFALRRAFQNAFLTNQYCSDQVLYREEQQYISKQGGHRPGNGYAIFPVYPIKMNISNNQCDLTEYINDNFTSFNGTMGGTIAEGLEASLTKGSAIATKCSYTYSAEHDQCFTTGLVPMMIVDYATQIVAQGIVIGCSLSGSSSASMAALIFKVVQISINLVGMALSSVASIFGSSLIQDPYTYKGVAAIVDTASFVIIDIIAIVQSIAQLTIWCIPIIILGRFTNIVAINVDFIIWEAAYFIKSKVAVKSVTFCGHDWFSYNKATFDYTTSNGTGENGETLSAEARKLLPTKGAYRNSRYKKVIDCIEKPGDGNCADILNDLEGGQFCAKDCEGIKSNSKDVKNKIYREFLYSGKEYFVGNNSKFYMDVEKNKDKSDNRSNEIFYDYKNCIDPRLSDDKGYDNISQAYYMKGNDKANFACGRYYYDGTSGCIIHKDKIKKSDDATNLVVSPANSDYYEVQKDSSIFEEYSVECIDAFAKARECCEYRSRNFICLEKREDKKKSNGTFCFANVVHEGDAVEYANLIDYLKKKNEDDSKVTCEVKTSNSYSVKFEASKKYGTDRVCVVSTNVCPYNFRLNAGLNYQASFCDSNTLTIPTKGDSIGVWQRFVNHLNKEKCAAGYFSENNEESYHTFASKFDINERNYNDYVFMTRVKTDMEGFNSTDFELIYNFSESKKSSSYTDSLKSGDKDVTVGDFYEISNGNVGKIKNFCQYSAHCVAVESEFEYNEPPSGFGIFMDASCSGESVNSRLKNIGNVSNITLKQLSSPIVECVYETLNNAIRGTAGSSICANDMGTNADGYCGNDSKEDVESAATYGDTAFFSKYKKDGEEEGIKGYIVKGLKLPESYNPFVKLKNVMVRIVRALFVLFLVIYGYLVLIKKKDIIGELKPSEAVFKALQFGLVMWLCVGNGVQSVVFDKVVDFSLGFYNTANILFSNALNAPINFVLTQDETERKLKITQNFFGGTVENFEICYRRGLMDNLIFSAPEADGSCPLFYDKNDGNITVYTGEKKVLNGLTIKNNQNINGLIYFIDTFNKTAAETLKLVGIDGDNKDEYDLEKIGLWNKHYDGCYFDPDEYPDKKSYLAIFDTLDCKVARYLGFSISSGAPFIITYASMLLLADKLKEAEIPVVSAVVEVVGKIYGFFGRMVFIALLTFFFAFLNVMIKVAYNFLSAFFTISILLFLAPLTLPFILLERTKKIAEGWMNNIIGSAVTPVLSIALTMVYITILDMFLLGAFNFSSNSNLISFSVHDNRGRTPTMDCKSDNDSNVICFLSKTPVFGQLAELFEDGKGLLLLLDVFVAIAIVKFGDSIVDEVKKIVEKLVTFGDAKAPETAGMSPRNISDTSMADSVFDVANKGADIVARAPETAIGKGAEILKDAGEKRKKKGTEKAKKLKKEINELKKDNKDGKNDKKILGLEKELKQAEEIAMGEDALRKTLDFVSEDLSDALINPVSFISDKVEQRIDSSHSKHTKRFAAVMRGLDSLTRSILPGATKGKSLKSIYKQRKEESKYDEKFDDMMDNMSEGKDPNDQESIEKRKEKSFFRRVKNFFLPKKKKEEKEEKEDEKKKNDSKGKK